MIDLVYLNELKRYENTLKRYDTNNPKKINKYAFQSEILDKNIPSLIKTMQKREYQYVVRDLPVDFNMRNWLAEQFGCCQVLEAYRMNENYKKRIQRLKSKITELFYFNESKNLYFLTFTFTDECLNKTDDLKRRRYVREWLNDNTTNFVANIDFGEEKGREHYHALVNADYIDISSWLKHGAMNYELVKINIKSIDKIAKYINKFLNHAIKETTKRQHIIYKREKRL